ncbi:uncharacterized mitochondrial protein AtMg00810-like [Capsicum annuum]|uniref:uncharacterized mitochondrial protein AtMg00810-like n=1 Tax=Capsicum annuum TaxID=4072 RepID=UPI001FB0C326|nr:uncharacterized mitochondrial protein AtMg00810-like [Capsicum annuum]
MKKAKGTDVLVVSLYVDDHLLIRSNDAMVNQFKRKIEVKFEMSDLGEMNYFMGMQIQQYTYGIFISKKKYAWDILKKFKMKRCKLLLTPLIHNERISKSERGDRADPRVYESLSGSLLHFTAQDVILCLQKDQGHLIGYTNSDWAECVDDMKNTSGYTFTLGSGMFSWNSKKKEVLS